tara:strand:- start:14453 stop:14740 length:288 start_codon:yes stop_codon:yes gene_type:complete
LNFRFCFTKGNEFYDPRTIRPHQRSHLRQYGTLYSWRPNAVPVKDRTREAFLTHVFKAFADDPSVDPERLTYDVMIVDKPEEGSQGRNCPWASRF